jgi:hypothetical protein
MVLVQDDMESIWKIELHEFDVDLGKDRSTQANEEYEYTKYAFSHSYLLKN